jgi:hypothetical protein
MRAAVRPALACSRFVLTAVDECTLPAREANAVRTAPGHEHLVTGLDEEERTTDALAEQLG